MRLEFRFIAAWVLQVLLAVLFTIQGVLKLASSPHWVSRFRGWGYPDHFYFVVGLAELVGAILLLIPRLTRWGAALLIVVMIGATATHAIHHEPQVVTTVVIIALLSIVVFLRRFPFSKSH